MSGGTFNVARSVWAHPVFKQEKFSEREAFLWLVSEASWKPRTVRAGKAVVDLERGQLCASVRFIAEAWGWTKSRVFRFLERLENRDMIGTDSGTGQMVITVTNYGKFQNGEASGGTDVERKVGHERDSSGTNEKKDERRVRRTKIDGDANASPSDPDSNDGFERFWMVYGHKVAKGAARKAFKAALRKADAETIIASAERYALSRNPSYVAHASTWLNGERWDDEAVPQQSQKTGAPHERKPRHSNRDVYAAFDEIDRRLGHGTEGGGPGGPDEQRGAGEGGDGVVLPLLAARHGR